MQAFPYVLLALGIVLTGVSLVAWFGESAIFGNKVKVDPEGKSDALWWRNSSHFTTTNFLKVYFFNVTNTEDVIDGEKPILQEIGPFVFEGNVTRIIDNIDEKKDVVTYKDLERFHFRPDLTNGRESDMLTIINFPYVSLAQEVSKLSSFPRIIVMGVITRYNEGLFLRKTAKQLLFGGYKHELLATLGSITGEQYMPNNTFGFFYARNNTDHGNFDVAMGLKESELIGQIQKWNSTSKLDWWKSEDCNEIGDSFDGTVFPKGITKTTVITYFDPEMCRKFKYGFKKEIKHHGIAGFRFTMLQEELEDPRIREENLCYCTSRGENYDGCPMKGGYQLNACAKGASITMSLPHFLHGAEEYLEMASGFSPDESKHEPYIDIEPITGTLLKRVKRSQVNLEVRPLRLFNGFKKVARLTFPAIWVEESKELTPERITELAPPSKLLHTYACTGIAVGAFLIIFSLIILFVRLRKNRTKYNT